MALDLTALSKKPAAASGGQPLDLPLDDIDADPDQPRKEFDEAALQELADSIKARASKAADGRGVISPVSVRPHPAKPGHWMLNHGERRWRASKLAGQKTVPAFVDAGHDDDDQALENVQRSDLTPMELAHHIRRQTDKGRSQSDVARRLGKDKPTITHYLALIDLPSSLAKLYEGGRCRSPRMLYDLRRLHAQHGSEVDAWADRTSDVTRRSVDELRARLKPAKPAPTPPAPVDGPAGDDGEYPSEVPPPSVGVPAGIAHPRLAVRYDGRSAIVLLERRPSADGQLVIAYEDGTESEVEARQCSIERLTDA